MTTDHFVAYHRPEVMGYRDIERFEASTIKLTAASAVGGKVWNVVGVMPYPKAFELAAWFIADDVQRAEGGDHEWRVAGDEGRVIRPPIQLNDLPWFSRACYVLWPRFADVGCMARKPYPSDVKDDEWAVFSPYLTLTRDDAPQRKHPLRELFDGLRWIVRTGSAWRYLPHDLPPWQAVYQQTRRWMDAEVFEQIAQDLRQLLRQLHEREPEPTAAVIDSRTLRSTPAGGSSP